jgi:pimeloyl-ACP methyl ester carboxylesterase
MSARRSSLRRRVTGGKRTILLALDNECYQNNEYYQTGRDIVEFADVAGIRLAYEVNGAGGSGTVVLAGGSGMPPVVWELCGLTTALQREGYQVLSYCARGVAPSDAPPPPYAMADLAGELAALLEYLGLSDCRLVGYSLGGFVAQLLARTRPDLVGAAILLASAGPPSPIDLARNEVESDVIATLGYLPAQCTRFTELLTSLPCAALRDDPEQVATWWELLRAHADSWSSADGEVGQAAAVGEWLHDPDRMTHLADIAVPVLVACFEHDLLLPPAGGRIAAAALPHGTFVQIPGAAHAGLMTHPDLCVAAVLNYLRSP